MGIGDEILALGRCEAYYELTGEPSAIVDATGKRRSHPAWVGNPAWDLNAAHTILDCSGHRGYIKKWENRRIIFDYNYRARAGKMVLLPNEKYPSGDFIVVNPHIKNNASPNKRWEWANWQAIVDLISYPVIQVGEAGDRVLEGVKFVETPTFRHAAGIISASRAVICHEGGMHHMAASMGKRAVVLFGAFAPPDVLGYSGHVNVFVETEFGFCGNFDICAHCCQAMEQITPEVVFHAFCKLDDRIRQANA